MAVRNDNGYYYDSLVIFRVEDMLFKVPRKEFEEQSEIFANMFAIPPGDNDEDGQRDERPLRLEGITSKEFVSFLKAMFPRPVLQSGASLTDTELEAALKLAKMWCFGGFCKQLVQRLEALKLSPSRKLQLARTYDIREWYKPELRLLALREGSVTLEEVMQIGLELVHIVSTLRDEKYRAIVSAEATRSSPRALVIERRIDAKLREISREHGWDSVVLIQSIVEPVPPEDCY